MPGSIWRRWAKPVGVGSRSGAEWLKTQLHELKHRGPDALLAEVQRLIANQPESADSLGHLTYLEKREAQMHYRISAAGWPIGDGAVESANKLVVEACLKGSGMHWSAHAGQSHAGAAQYRLP